MVVGTRGAVVVGRVGTVVEAGGRIVVVPSTSGGGSRAVVGAAVGGGRCVVVDVVGAEVVGCLRAASSRSSCWLALWFQNPSATMNAAAPATTAGKRQRGP